jgi:hypothetical protein
MAKVLVGKDVTAYTVYGAGDDSVSASFTASTSYSLVGRWKDIKVSIDGTWTKVTSSDGIWAEKRLTELDWRGTLNNLVRSNMSVGLLLSKEFDYIQVSFAGGEGTVTLMGGISQGSYEAGREARMDGLEIENIGVDANGGFYYA